MTILLLGMTLIGCAAPQKSTDSNQQKSTDSNIYELSRNGVLFSWSSPISRTYEGCSKFLFKVTNRGKSDLMNITVDLVPSGLSLILSNIAVGQTKVRKFDCVTNVSPEGSNLIVFYNSKDNLVGEVFEEFIVTEDPSE